MEIADILEMVDLTWFTVLLHGDRIRRYVVAFTNNVVWDIPTLEAQFKHFSSLHDNITLGWRTDPQDNVFIDIWTSTDSLAEAHQLQKAYNQQAIRDTVTREEIF